MRDLPGGLELAAVVKTLRGANKSVAELKAVDRATLGDLDAPVRLEALVLAPQQPAELVGWLAKLEGMHAAAVRAASPANSDGAED